MLPICHARAVMRLALRVRLMFVLSQSSRRSASLWCGCAVSNCQWRRGDRVTTLQYTILWRISLRRRCLLCRVARSVVCDYGHVVCAVSVPFTASRGDVGRRQSVSDRRVSIAATSPSLAYSSCGCVLNTHHCY
jgi:hypothetical protein